MENRFDPSRQIALIWDIEDVQGVRPHLTDAQALEVLHQVEHHHDADHGVNWETLEGWADTLYPSSQPAPCAENG